MAPNKWWVQLPNTYVPGGSYPNLRLIYGCHVTTT